MSTEAWIAVGVLTYLNAGIVVVGLFVAFTEQDEGDLSVGRANMGVVLWPFLLILVLVVAVAKIVKGMRGH
jgi:hypothetical protein